MSDQAPDSIQLYEALLRSRIATLEAERKRVEAESARIETEMTQARSTLADLVRIGTAATAAVPIAAPVPTQDSFEAETPKAGLFAGLELSDAIYKYLALNKEMRSLKEIWSALEDAGFKVLSGHPTRAVSEALRKRAHRHNDVFKAGGRWGATKNFSNIYIKRITKKHAGMGGVSAEEHAAKTSDGIERRRAAGLKVGAPRKLDAAMAVRIRHLREQGTSIVATCEAVGISVGLYSMYRNRLKIWKEGTLWPPPEPTKEQLALLDLEEAQSQSTHLRVVK